MGIYKFMFYRDYGSICPFLQRPPYSTKQYIGLIALKLTLSSTLEFDSVFFLYLFNFFLFKFNLPTYSITPELISSSALLSARHPVTPNNPPPFPLPLVNFPELGVSHVLSPSLIFPTHFLSFPLYSLSLFFIFLK